MSPLSHKCRFWQNDRGFFPYQCFLFDWLPLFISPWQQILFYLPFLSISAFAAYPPLLFTTMFPPLKCSHFPPFLSFFFNQTSVLFKTFLEGVMHHFLGVFFQHWGCFYLSPLLKTFLNSLQRRAFFFVFLLAHHL